MHNRELGDLIGVSPSMASRLRSGQRLPSVKVMREISRVFGVDMARLTEAHEKGSEEFGRVFADAIAARISG